jgi:hypothetical protein
MDGERAYASRPDSVKRLRACTSCKLIKTYDQFLSECCENCPHTRPESDVHGMRKDWVENNTTSDFEGWVGAQTLPPAA